MKRKNTTRNALLTSIISMLLCVSMLVGATFAWFTDSVESGINQIAAGNLDVELYHTNTKDSNEKVTASTKLFDEVTPNLWEPGAVAYENLTVVNEGSLALKYQLAINFENATVHNGHSLDEALKVGVVRGGFVGTTREAVLAEVSEWQTMTSFNLPGDLSAQEAETYGIVIYWEPTENDNWFNMNNENQGKVLSIDLGVKLVATQKDAEYDSFGNDYDKDASVVVSEDGLTLAQAIAQVEDNGIVFIEPGTYNLQSGPIVIEGKTVTVIGLSNVTLNKNYGSTHIFTVKNGANVTIENVTMDGQGNTREGIYVRWNSVVTLKNVVIKNTGGKDIMVDEASDAAHGEETASYVWLYNTQVEDVALCASPVTSVAATQDTFVYFNYDADSSVGSIEKQNINKKPENIYINGINVEGNGMNLYVRNDAELAAALETIKNDSKYHNVQVYVHLAAGEYSANHVINQYPLWNGIVGRNNGNNYQGGVTAGDPSTTITFVGETASTYSLRGAQAAPAVVFTGNVTVNGFGDAQAGFGTAVARTTFENIAFANSTNANADGDIVAVTMTAAAANVTFNQCSFQDAGYVVVGARACNIVGDITFDGCTFSDVCISGYVDKTITVKNSVVINADGGFINNQNNGDIVVDNCTINAGRYFVRTNGINIDISVSNSDITMYESEGTKHLVHFRGSNETAEFVDCTIADGYTTEGVDANSTLEIYNYSETADGLILVTDGITDEVTLYLVPAEYEGTTVNVPEGVDTIGGYAFYYNTNVETIVLPNSVTTLDMYSFRGTSATKVVLNEGLTEIGAYAFSKAGNLKEINFPSTVTTVGEQAFRLAGFETLTIPATVANIETGAFRDLANVTTITIEGNPVIANFAFRSCPNLTTVNLLGNNVTFSGTSQAFCRYDNGAEMDQITIYVANQTIADRLAVAQGSAKGYTVVCEQTAQEGGYYTDDQGNAHAYDAQGLVAALEAKKNVTLYADSKIDPAGMSNAYGTTGINVKNGQTIDGQGNVLDIQGAGGTWDSGINTTGGLIKNITITGSFRGIFINHNSDHSEKVVLENVIIDGTTYTISCDQGKNQNLEATNCTFNGWTSYAATIGNVKFTDCSFGEGNGYAFCRPYAPTEFVGCDFAVGYTVDPRAAVTFENCTIAGVPLTAENVTELVTGTANVTVK